MERTLNSIADKMDVTDVLYRYASTIDRFDLGGLRRTLADVAHAISEGHDNA